MKKYRRLLAFIMVLSLVFCGCTPSDTDKNSDTKTENDGQNTDEKNNEQEVEYPYDYASAEFFKIQNCWKYAPVAKVSGVRTDGSDFKLDAVDGYMTMQGGCTDGTYAYLLLEKKNVMDQSTGNKVSYCMLFKVDMASWTVVGQSEPLAVDHGNGITYNPNTNQLLVAHCQNRTQEFSYIDPNTLKVTGSKSLERNFYSITYNATYDKYVIGIKGTNNFVIYDGAFNKLGEYEGVDPGLGYQNIACDDDYIYITYTGENNAIMCYDWDGYFCGVYWVDSYIENEAMFHVGEEYYMTFYTGGGGTVCRLTFDKDLLF